MKRAGRGHSGQDDSGHAVAAPMCAAAGLEAARSRLGGRHSFGPAISL